MGRSVSNTSNRCGCFTNLAVLNTKSQPLVSFVWKARL